jgi:outer membrane protein OmpA-like peptidoglycan-associated protein
MNRVLFALVLSLTLVAQTTFADHESRGKDLAAGKQWAKARKEFHAALGEAASEIQSAVAAFRIAQTYRGEGNIDSALDWYRQSLQYHKSAQAEQEMMQVESQRLGKQVPAADIKAALLVPPSDRSPVAEENSIDLDILFGFNDARLTSEGRNQVHQLALAIGSNDFRGKSFRITGHTDSVGGDEYNLKLSLERANSVRDVLANEAGISAGQLKCEGKGKREPKYHNDSEEARRLNRRVQVTLVE